MCKNLARMCFNCCVSLLNDAKILKMRRFCCAFQLSSHGTKFEGIEPHDSNCLPITDHDEVNIVENEIQNLNNDNRNVKRVIRCSTYSDIFTSCSRISWELKRSLGLGFLVLEIFQDVLDYDWIQGRHIFCYHFYIRMFSNVHILGLFHY